MSFYALGRLVRARAVHNDFKCKNIAADRKSVRFTDLVDMRLFPINGHRISDEEEAKALHQGDLEDFSGTLLGIGEVDNLIKPTLENPVVRDRLYAVYRMAGSAE